MFESFRILVAFLANGAVEDDFRIGYATAQKTLKSPHLSGNPVNPYSI
tara:strand:+ start:93 stop:236 length:144 start_codon:yes stop_codon:yes gene_type:complete